LKAPWTITLLAVLASLAVAAPAAATPDAPAQEEYILKLPSADGGADAGRSEDAGRSPARVAGDPKTLGSVTADAGVDGSTILVVILAVTALAGISVAIVKAVK
jgi:hypothetical protein